MARNVDHKKNSHFPLNKIRRQEARCFFPILISIFSKEESYLCLVLFSVAYIRLIDMGYTRLIDMGYGIKLILLKNVFKIVFFSKIHLIKTFRDCVHLSSVYVWLRCWSAVLAVISIHSEPRIVISNWRTFSWKAELTAWNWPISVFPPTTPAGWAPHFAAPRRTPHPNSYGPFPTALRYQPMQIQ